MAVVMSQASVQLPYGCAVPCAPLDLAHQGSGALLSTGSSVVASVACEPRTPCRQGFRDYASWRLVWCSERCHKQDQEGTRKGLAEATREAGGAFVCMKKAAKYVAWLSQQQRGPHVLLADWREVKPCMDALEGEIRDRPVLIVIYAESQRVYERVNQWIEGMRVRGLQDRILIAHDLASARALVASVVDQTRPSPPACLDKLSSENLLRAQLAAGAYAAYPAVASAASTASGSATPTTAAGSPASADDEGSPLSFGSFGSIEGTDVEELNFESPCLRVQRVLSGIFPSQDAADVESMLVQAMPHFYED